MNNVEQRAHRFYKALQQKDYAEMAKCYHEEAIFSDSVFQNLNKERVSKMWEMLLKRGKDLQVEYAITQVEDKEVKAHWTARYTFSQTGKPVVNEIDAQLEFKDGLIYRHTDTFDFYKWSSQALGTPGSLLGWTSFFKSSIRKRALGSLDKYMKENPDII